MGYQAKFFKYCVGFVLILLILFLLGQLGYLFKPIFRMVTAIFYPLFISGVLYYLLRPMVHFGEKVGLSTGLSIGIIFLLITIILGAGFLFTENWIGHQTSQFIRDFPKLLSIGKSKAESFTRHQNIGLLFTGRIQQQVAAAAQKTLPQITGSVLWINAMISEFAVLLITVPFLLFFWLMDDFRFARRLRERFPKRYRMQLIELMDETDRILSLYITGQILLALMIGVLLFVGYLILGVKFSMILGLFSVITALIPLFGPIIGVIPALLFGLAVNPWMALKIIILNIVVYMLVNHLIAPNLIGKKLNIHPVMLVLLFLITATTFGFVGLLVVVPVYAVLRVALRTLIQIVQSGNSDL